ncbi:MAG: hypothetical protein ACI9FJ_001022 [Alteromonadaceae bacterium]|jgi:hypothetical protein
MLYSCFIRFVLRRNDVALVRELVVRDAVAVAFALFWPLSKPPGRLRRILRHPTKPHPKSQVIAHFPF